MGEGLGMKIQDGDHVKVATWGARDVEVEIRETRDLKRHMFLYMSPEQARKLARKLNMRASQLEIAGRNA